MSSRTKPEVEEQIVLLLARRTTHTDIAAQTGLSVSGIKKIKRRNAYRLQAIERQLTDWQADATINIRRRLLAEINHRLDLAEAGLTEISIRELVAISHEMHRQVLESRGKA